ncbi:metallophosphoesterase [Candidatus Palauibacter sp.]|uniref:metallophosphoesterase n=1 Tax=Candidatus Palauibacter sp. TaxID=3101350 RepID=UPI003B026125
MRDDPGTGRPGLVGCAVAAAGFGWLGSPGTPVGHTSPPVGHTSPPVAPPAGSGQAAWRFGGEYGLYVGLDSAGLEVRWLTEESASGLVRALVDDRVVDEQRTPRGDAHEAGLRVEAPVVTIEYGADGADRLHRTEIRLDPPPRPAVDLPGSDSVFVFGDVHGEFDRVLQLLARAELIDGELRWTGGGATLALLGDLLDRGDDVTRLLWFVYRLEREAEAAGGRVLTMLGNHEAMVMSGDLRYVSPKEVGIAERHDLSYQRLFDPATSILGRWLAAKPGLVQIGDLLLAHGGVSPTYLDYSVRSYQDTLETFISEPLFTGWHDPEFLEAFAGETSLDSAQVYRRYEFFFAPESVLWYRDLVLTDTLGAHLDAVLDRFGAAVHVVGHTPVRGIRESYGGRLIGVDLLDAAAEMLFLARRPGGGWDRFAVGFAGDFVKLPLVP